MAIGIGCITAGWLLKRGQERTKCAEINQMRILFVSTNLPVPANNGYAIRSLSIVQALASNGHELDFVSFVGKDRFQALDPLASYCRKIDLLEPGLTNLSQRVDYLQRLLCLFSFRPYALQRFRSELMLARIQQQVKKEHYDLIVCDGLHSLANVPKTEVPIVLNCHNVEHLIFKRYSQIEKNLLKKWYASMEAQLILVAERRSCHRIAIAMTCSKEDRDTLHQLQPRLPIFVVPNAVDTDSISADLQDEPVDKSPILLFQGGMDWYPNRDAVEFFARSILPLVRAEFPHVRFLVAGRNPPPNFVEELNASSGVEFTGTVPDMRPYLSAATAVVVPLRIGSGTRIKILEAGAAGKPIVSTSVGAEGLELKAEQEIVLADDPAAFANSVISLLRDPERRNLIGKSARTVIVERYSHLALKKSLDAVTRSLVQGNNSTSNAGGISST
jgi:glycosyltransferase involved in cell wall biosynthesis